MKKFNVRGALGAINRKMSYPVKIVLFLALLASSTAIATTTASVTLSDGEWIGLGASAGRLEVDDQATDVLSIEDADFKVPAGIIYGGTVDNTRGEVTLYGAGASSANGGRLRLHAAADHDSTFQSWVVNVDEDDLRIATSDGVVEHRFGYAEGAVFNEFGAASQDFRVEGDTAADLLLVDASDDKVSVNGLFSFGVETQSAVSSGSVVLSSSYHELTAESGGTDDLDNLTGGTKGDLVILTPAPTYTIVVKHASGGSGQIYLNGGSDFTMLYSGGSIDHLILWNIGDAWIEVGRMDS